MVGARSISPKSATASRSSAATSKTSVAFDFQGGMLQNSSTETKGTAKVRGSGIQTLWPAHRARSRTVKMRKPPGHATVGVIREGMADLRNP